MKNENVPVEYIGYCEGFCDGLFMQDIQHGFNNCDDYDDVPLGVESSHMQIGQTAEDKKDGGH